MKRGPSLGISGLRKVVLGQQLQISSQSGNAVPPVIAKASFERRQRNSGATEIVEIPNHGHADDRQRLERGCEYGPGVRASALFQRDAARGENA